MEDKELLIEDNESCFELRLEDLNVDKDEEEAFAFDEDLVGSGTFEMEYSSGIDRKFVSFSHFSSSPFVFSFSSLSALDLDSNPETKGLCH